MDPTQALNKFIAQHVDNLIVNEGKRIVINLSSDDLVEDDKLIGELTQRIGHNVSDALFLLTGRKNTFREISRHEMNDEEQHRVGRSILEDKSAKDASDFDLLVNVTDCLFFFSRTIYYGFFNVTNLNDQSINLTAINLTEIRPDVSASHCWTLSGDAHQTNQTQPALLSLSFGAPSSLKLSLTIDSRWAPTSRG